MNKLYPLDCAWKSNSMYFTQIYVVIQHPFIHSIPSPKHRPIKLVILAMCFWPMQVFDVNRCQSMQVEKPPRFQIVVVAQWSLWHTLNFCTNATNIRIHQIHLTTICCFQVCLGMNISCESKSCLTGSEKFWSKKGTPSPIFHPMNGYNIYMLDACSQKLTGRSMNQRLHLKV